MVVLVGSYLQDINFIICIHIYFHMIRTKSYVNVRLGII